MTELRRDRRRRRPQRPDRRRAYLARAGLRVCMLERRDVLGGACVTEELWPGQRVSRASYVVSMLQPKVVADLELQATSATTRSRSTRRSPRSPPTARPILFHNDEAAAHASLARVSRKDADAMPRFEALLERVADFLRPMMLRPPPALGSKHPGDVLELLREAAPRRRHGPARRSRSSSAILTMSVGDLLDDWFENDALKGSYASTGVVGVWAGPRTPGTAYNLLHHDARRARRRRAAPGATCAAAWARSRRRSPRSARAAGADDPHRRRGARRSTCAGGRVHRRDARRPASELRAPRRAVRRAPEDDGARPRRRASTSPTRSSRTCAATAPAAGR